MLKVVADIASRPVFAEDFVAWLLGDEFVALFRSAQLSNAQQMFARTKLSVGRHDWSRLAPEVSVSISFGVEQAREGEFIWTLLGTAALARLQ